MAGLDPVAGDGPEREDRERAERDQDQPREERGANEALREVEHLLDLRDLGDVEEAPERRRGHANEPVAEDHEARAHVEREAHHHAQEGHGDLERLRHGHHRAPRATRHPLDFAGALAVDGPLPHIRAGYSRVDTARVAGAARAGRREHGQHRPDRYAARAWPGPATIEASTTIACGDGDPIQTNPTYYIYFPAISTARDARAEPHAAESQRATAGSSRRSRSPTAKARESHPEVVVRAVEAVPVVLAVERHRDREIPGLA